MCRAPASDAVGGMDQPQFIRANTKLLPVPLVPEIRLHLAEESLPIWRKTEEELGEMNVPPPYWAFAWAGGQALARYLLDNPDAVAGPACSTSARAAGSRRSRRCGPGPRACSPPISMLSRWRPSTSTLPPTP